MGKTKKLNHKESRYLSKKEFKDPLYAIADFCRSTCSLSGYQAEIKDIIRASNTCPRRLKPLKTSNLFFYCKQIVKHIELLYVLERGKIDWKIDPATAYHKQTINLNSHRAYDETLYGGTYLNFEQLKLAEMKDIGVFIKKFFGFKSLREWHKTMDDVLETFFEEYSLSDLVPYAKDQSKIFNYLEKLADAIFLVYATKARERIFKYYIKEFSLEKYLEKEEPKVGDQPIGPATSAAENPATDAADDDA